MITEWIPVRANLPAHLLEDSTLMERVSSLSNETIKDEPKKLLVFKAYQRQRKNNISGSISIAPLFKGDGSTENFEYSYFIGAFSDVIRYTGSTENAIIAERFGLGIEINLKISDVKTAIRGGFGMIAAAVSMDLADVEYSYHIHSLPQGNFYSQLPQMGKFDTESIKKFKLLVAKLKELYEASSDDQELSAIEVLVATSIKETGTEYSRDYYYAAKLLIEGNSLAKAITTAREKRNGDGTKMFNEDAIQYFYSRAGLNSIDALPDTSNINEAKKFINIK